MQVADAPRAAAAAPEPRRLNLGCGRDIRDGWVNVDAFVDDPRVVKHDMIKFPWTFARDNEFDLVYMSHVLEHVPTIFEEENGVKRDVLFRLMEEIHRVLKPGGALHVRVPYAGTHAAYAHPQHYRHIVPDWFQNFDPDGAENYYSTARFRLEWWRRNPWHVRGEGKLRFGPSRLGLVEHIWARLPKRMKPWLMLKDELEMYAVALK